MILTYNKIEDNNWNSSNAIGDINIDGLINVMTYSDTHSSNELLLSPIWIEIYENQPFKFYL